jgi:S1-C subfamily serine protease
MNNIGVLVNGTISIIQKSALFVATFLSLLSPTTSSISTSTTSSLGLKASTSAEKSKEIVDILNRPFSNPSSSTSAVYVPMGTDKITSAVDKLKHLKITAPNYSVLKISTKQSKDNSTPNQIKKPQKSNILSDTDKTPTSNTSSNIKSHISTSPDDSVVNIRCENKTSNTLKIITGSGVIISSNGLVLTAAHVAAPVYSEQSGGKYSCYARIKDPASGKLPVKVVFIDRDWVNKHYSNFENTYSETGESDIAILQIDISNPSINTATATELKNILPAKISPLPFNLNEQITIKSYPSDVYGKIGVFSVLPRKSETNSIGNVFNFNGDSNGPYDLIETKPSSLAQSGASGGGIFNNQGQLIGIISNYVSSEILLKNKIRAISIKHIDNKLRMNLGKSIYEMNQ